MTLNWLQEMGSSCLNRKERRPVPRHPQPVIRLLCRPMTADEEKRFRAALDAYLFTLVDMEVNKLRTEHGQERTPDRPALRSGLPMQ